MPVELHVQFRLPPDYAKKLKALAELHAMPPNLAARMVLIDSLEDSRQAELADQIAALDEQIAALRAAQREQGEEFKALRGELNAALRKTLDGRAK
jgi:chaperonin cofactor prefoldin